MGIDPGTKKVGWGVFRNGELLDSGCYTFGDWPFMVVLPGMIIGTAVPYRVTEIFYEHTGHHASTASAHSHGEGRACILQAAWTLRVPAIGIMYSSIKKVATGRGDAKKPMMVEACYAKFGLQTRLEDQAEGIWTAYCGHMDLGERAKDNLEPEPKPRKARQTKVATS